MKTATLRSFLALFAVGVLSCAPQSVKPTPSPETAPVSPPALEFRGVQFEKQSFGGSQVGFRFALVSTDEHEARTKGCDYTLAIEGLAPLQGKIDTPAQLAPKSELPVTAAIAIPWPDNREAVFAFLNRGRPTYQYQITCRVETSAGPIEARAGDSGSLVLPKLPNLKVLQAYSERFGAGLEARFTYELSVVNENPFPIHLNKILYKIYLSEVLASEGTLDLLESIPGSNEFSYDLTTPIFTEREHRKIVGLFKTQELAYRLDGSALVDGFELPFSIKGTIPLSR